MEKNNRVPAEIITIGDEILLGQTIDTNSAWIGERFANLGIVVTQITTIPDQYDRIISALDKALQHAEIVIITGGLGPTKDDITKKTLCDYFDCKTVFDEKVFEDVKEHFRVRGIEMPAINRMQAEVPEAATPLQNKLGTAPGLLFERGNKTIVSMAGVPYEMKYIMEHHVFDLLKNKYNAKPVVKQTLLTHGIGETSLNELIKDWEDSLDNDQLSIAYLPSPGMVKIRLTYQGNGSKGHDVIDKKIEELQEIIPDYYLGRENERLEVQVGQLLKKANKTLCTAESCTGGYIGHLITSIPGSSAYFNGGVISYSNEVKQELLGVSKEDLEKHGAVSQPVVEQMAKGALKATNSDFAIATSGVAGPDGGTKEKPVGTVWVAVASKEKVVSEMCSFGKSRDSNIKKSALKGLGMLYKMLLER